MIIIDLVTRVLTPIKLNKTNDQCYFGEITVKTETIWRNNNTNLLNTHSLFNRQNIRVINLGNRL